MKRKFFKPKKYSNPYLPRLTARQAKKRVADPVKKKKRKRIFILFILLLVLAGLVYLVIYSSLFKITKIVVSGAGKNEILNEIQIIANRETSGRDLYIWPRDNILLLNIDMLGAVIDSQVALDKLEIEKKFLHTLKIEADEKVPQLLWNEGKDYFYIDKNGIVMGAVRFEDVEYDLALINRGTTTQIIVGRKIIKADNIKFINDFLAKVRERIKDWQVIQVVTPTVDSSEMSFYTNEGWYFMVKAGGNIEMLVYNLEQLLIQKVDDRSKLEYIDLRIEDRIFYKSKEE